MAYPQENWELQFRKGSDDELLEIPNPQFIPFTQVSSWEGLSMKWVWVYDGQWGCWERENKKAPGAN